MDKFADNVFQVWDRLGSDQAAQESLPKYLQLLLLVCIHVFLKEDIRVAIIETHHGGQYDSTNIFSRPVATAVTSLGMDHVEQLGPTISDIAWHKAGIFKHQSPAYALDGQPEAARKVLIQRASDVQTTLEFIKEDPTLPRQHPIVKPVVQRCNLSLAKALVQCYLDQEAPREANHLSADDVELCLDMAHLPGRFQRLQVGSIEWFLDGAHNTMSIGNPLAWFAAETRTSLPNTLTDGKISETPPETPRLILVFSHISSERDGQELVQTLIQSVSEHKLVFDNVIFCYDGLRKDGSRKLGECSVLLL